MEYTEKSLRPFVGRLVRVRWVDSGVRAWRVPDRELELGVFTLCGMLTKVYADRAVIASEWTDDLDVANQDRSAIKMTDIEELDLLTIERRKRATKTRKIVRRR